MWFEVTGDRWEGNSGRTGGNREARRPSWKGLKEKGGEEWETRCIVLFQEKHLIEKALQGHTTIEAAVCGISMKRNGLKAERNYSFTLDNTGQVLSQFSGEKKVFYKEEEQSRFLYLLWGWPEFWSYKAHSSFRAQMSVSKFTFILLQFSSNMGLTVSSNLHACSDKTHLMKPVKDKLLQPVV